MNIGMITLGVIFGMALSVVLFFLWENRKTSKATTKSEEILSKAEHKREKILEEARQNAE